MDRHRYTHRRNTRCAKRSTVAGSRSASGRPRRGTPGSLEHELERVLDTCPGYNLGKAYKRVSREFEQEFRSGEVTLGQFALLVSVGVAAGSSATEIADRLGSDISTISRTMVSIVKQGFVRQSRGADRRVRVYELTPSGRAALEATLPKWRTAKMRVLRSLGCRWPDALHAIRKLAR